MTSIRCIVTQCMNSRNGLRVKLSVPKFGINGREKGQKSIEKKVNQKRRKTETAKIIIHFLHKCSDFFLSNAPYGMHSHSIYLTFSTNLQVIFHCNHFTHSHLHENMVFCAKDLRNAHDNPLNSFIQNGTWDTLLPLSLSTS